MVDARRVAGGLAGADPRAEVDVVLEVPDGDGDFLPCPVVGATGFEPCPWDDGRFLARARVSLRELLSGACDPYLLRALAEAIEREADATGGGE